MRISPISSHYTKNYNSNPRTTFNGTKEEIISESFKEFVSGALPIYKLGRAVQKLGDGDSKGAIKQTVGMVDNIVCQPVKQMAASAVAAKGALVGSVFGPVGAGIGAIVGYVGTLWGWGKARNTVVDTIMDD